MVFHMSNDKLRAIIAGLERVNRSINWLAARGNVDSQKLYNWVNGVNKPRDPRILDDLLDIVQKENPDPNDRSVRVMRAHVRFVPVYNGLPAGRPGQYSGDPEYVEMVDWSASTERYGRIIQGNSMESLLDDEQIPGGIMNGDTVIFETMKPERNHVVHAYNATMNEDTCKILDGNRLVPKNPDYEPLLMAESGGVWLTLGVAIKVMRPLSRGATASFEFPSGLKFKVP